MKAITKETLIQISMSIKFQQNLNNINEHSRQNWLQHKCLWNLRYFYEPFLFCYLWKKKGFWDIIRITLIFIFRQMPVQTEK